VAEATECKWLNHPTNTHINRSQTQCVDFNVADLNWSSDDSLWRPCIYIQASLCAVTLWAVKLNTWHRIWLWPNRGRGKARYVFTVGALVMVRESPAKLLISEEQNCQEGKVPYTEHTHSTIADHIQLWRRQDSILKPM